MKELAHFCFAAAVIVPAAAFAALNLTSPNCTAEVCPVTVSVSGAGCGGGVTVAPDPLILKVGKPSDIQWTVATPGWDFTSNGININIPGGEFEPGKLVDRKTYKIRNKNTKRGTYKYDINLTGSDGRTCSLDPTIMNY